MINKHIDEYLINIQKKEQLYNLIFLGSAESGSDASSLNERHSYSTYGVKTNTGDYIISGSVFWNASKPRYLFSMKEIVEWNPKFAVFAVPFNPDIDYKDIYVEEVGL